MTNPESDVAPESPDLEITDDTRTAADNNTAETEASTAHPMHKVLSFVRRSGRLDDRLQRAWDRYADTYLLDIAAGNGLLDVREGVRLNRAFIERTWGNGNPLIVEIGTGQGENVVAAAATHPDTNFLALEVYDPGVAHTMLLAGKQELTNLRVAQVNAPELFKVAEAGSVAEVWTFFPDPWPKKKHHKRRIVQEGLAADIHRALGEGGVWRIATDIEDYALHVHEVMDDLPGWHNIGTMTASLPLEHVGKGNADLAADMPHADFTESERFAGRVLTNFEKKGLTAGRVIHDFTYQTVGEGMATNTNTDKAEA
ncbi:tRNA (guanosine(46)-N7)-methyltransferase TrmB [Bifidobacterium miconisargentati]|uniref:tRNA (guanosine(46)-N7)-methyltransferase TrmB n=1 Tax=Bifidobacterium miconisargentati TaxID=2834437 RepID=UPI001BDCCC85|nr:tRNA (guanosine(46)-N7)-methyltransferase TrmB [Bifidobacterium miconisargentati]MBW3090942.1 tRNA (guanosine(46)-N7)-methyltransferase TrmB [Bifidobacterium miconisargentati]